MIRISETLQLGFGLGILPENRKMSGAIILTRGGEGVPSPGFPLGLGRGARRTGDWRPGGEPWMVGVGRWGGGGGAPGWVFAHRDLNGGPGTLPGEHRGSP